MALAFRQAIDREELLIRKCDCYFPDLKDENLIDLINDFRDNAGEHIKQLKDKMIKLNIQG